MLNKEECALMKHYSIVHQQVDGGWGTHLESPSTMFGSTLMYVALRLLGVPADDPVAERGRNFLLDNGGATYTASWCKFYLCLLGVMDWATGAEGEGSSKRQQEPRSLFPSNFGKLTFHSLVQ